MPEQHLTVPRWLALLLASFVWLVGIPLGHGVLPWAISWLTPRYGWTDGRPDIWNLLGMVPLAAGVALLIWVMVVGLAETPKRVELGLTPSFLLQRGPYARTRNPMYVAELSVWFGWAILFGSVGVAIGIAVLWLLLNFVVLPREERGLDARLGQAYRAYKHRVPRWLGSVKDE